MQMNVTRLAENKICDIKFSETAFIRAVAKQFRSMMRRKEVIMMNVK